METCQSESDVSMAVRPRPRFKPGQCVMTPWGTPVWIDGEPWWENGKWVYRYDYNLGRSEGYASEYRLSDNGLPSWLVHNENDNDNDATSIKDTNENNE